MKAAEVLARTLEGEGTEVVFTLSGNQIMPVFDAVLDTSLRLIHTRHEAAAGFMAEGYAQVSGKVGVALVTAGAGLGNAIAPLLTARASQTPLLLLSGDSPAGMDGRGAFQEMDQVALTSSLTKLSRRIVDPTVLEAEIRSALDTARAGQPGPVHLSLPVDMLSVEVKALGGPARVLEQPRPDIRDIVAALRSAERPLLLLGPDLTATRAGRDIGALGLPVVPMESPRGANDPGLGRFARAWWKADLVVVLGKPIDFSLRFGAQEAWPDARWLTVHGDIAEVRRAELNLGERLIAARHGTPRRFAEALLDQAEEIGRREAWCAQVKALRNGKPDVRPAETGIDSPALCHAVNALTATEMPQIFVMDGGEFGQWAQALIRPSRRIVNGVSGAIGGGIGYAIGAKAAAPDAEVIALMGDGTAGFHLLEFETAVRENLPFIAVIGNDRRWNAEHELQCRTFGEDRTHGCVLSPARYDLAVKSMGGFGVHVTRQDALADALAEARASGRPACVNVDIIGLPAPVFT